MSPLLAASSSAPSLNIFDCYARSRRDRAGYEGVSIRVFCVRVFKNDDVHRFFFSLEKMFGKPSLPEASRCQRRVI
jgi:hypothetical protein